MRKSWIKRFIKFIKCKIEDQELIDEEDSEQEVVGFILSGGSVSWTEWISWTDEMKIAAIKKKAELENIRLLHQKFDFATSDEEKLGYADCMREYDGGALSKNFREYMNYKAFYYEHKTGS